MTTVQRWIARAAFAVYLIVLVWIILFKASGATWLAAFDPRYRNPSPELMRVINWLPSLNAREKAFNLLAFLPLGYFLMLFNRRLPFPGLLLIIFLLSLALEATQYWLAIGTADITDLISNTLGGLLGLVICGVMKKALDRRSEAVCAYAGALGVLLMLGLVVRFSKF